MAVEPCWLTNQTGAIIRFRPSQLVRLPTDDLDINVELFDGRVVGGRFHRHPANPYVAGPEVRHFILSRVPTQSREQAIIDVAGCYWRLFEATPVAAEVRRHGVAARRVASRGLRGTDLDRILRRIDAIAGSTARKRAYERLLRPPGLRRMVLELFGSSCQVDNCTAAEDAVDTWDDAMAGVAIVEVHHIDAIARREDHRPRNLCVLCGNHHRLIHGFGPWTIVHEGDDVVLSIGARQMRISRDLSVLQ